MGFVNQIADVVHFCVDKFGGSANKNIGEAFLLIWKFKERDVIRDNNDVMLREKSRTAKVTADLALFSFLKILAKINKL